MEDHAAEPGRIERPRDRGPVEQGRLTGTCRLGRRRSLNRLVSDDGRILAPWLASSRIGVKPQ